MQNLFLKITISAAIIIFSSKKLEKENKIFIIEYWC